MASRTQAAATAEAAAMVAVATEAAAMEAAATVVAAMEVAVAAMEVAVSWHCTLLFCLRGQVHERRPKARA